MYVESMSVQPSSFSPTTPQAPLQPRTQQPPHFPSFNANQAFQTSLTPLLTERQLATQGLFDPLYRFRRHLRAFFNHLSSPLVLPEPSFFLASGTEPGYRRSEHCVSKHTRFLSFNCTRAISQPQRTYRESRLCSRRRVFVVGRRMRRAWTSKKKKMSRWKRKTQQLQNGGG